MRGPRSAADDVGLTREMRKFVLLTHILSAVSWIGVDLVMGVLSFRGLTTDDPQTLATAYGGLALFCVPLLLTLGLLTLTTGVVAGRSARRFGLARYWWVATKLVITVGPVRSCWCCCDPLSPRGTQTALVRRHRLLRPRGEHEFLPRIESCRSSARPVRARRRSTAASATSGAEDACEVGAVRVRTPVRTACDQALPARSQRGAWRSSTRSARDARPRPGTTSTVDGASVPRGVRRPAAGRELAPSPSPAGVSRRVPDDAFGDRRRRPPLAARW